MTQTMTAPDTYPDTERAAPVLTVENLSVRYATREVLHGVSLDVGAGEVVGLIGESGSGKTTVARAVLGTVSAAGGRLTVDGQETTGSTARQRRRFRREGHAQYVFQHPLESLDGRFTARQAVRQGARETFGKQDAEAHVRRALEAVQLDESLWNRRPGGLSGGQRQRVAIARALAVDPTLLVCDEPVSALDASSRIEVIRTLQKTAETGTGILLISHDLSSLGAIADRILVLNEGTIVEAGATNDVLGAPQHPYTRRLIAAIPTIDGATDQPQSFGRAADELNSKGATDQLRTGSDTPWTRTNRHVNSPTGSIHLPMAPASNLKRVGRPHPPSWPADSTEHLTTVHTDHRNQPVVT